MPQFIFLTNLIHLPPKRKPQQDEMTEAWVIKANEELLMEWLLSFLHNILKCCQSLIYKS